MHYFICILLYFSLTNSAFSQEGNYIIESIIPGYDGEQKIYQLTLFLPYNPTIVSFSDTPKVKDTCRYWWPKGQYFSGRNYSGNSCDLLWLENLGNELEILHGIREQVQKAKVIYTSTYLGSDKPSENYHNLRAFLESLGYTQLGHWFWENRVGEAMFVKSDLLDAAMNTLNFTPSNVYVASIDNENRLENHFKKAKGKSLSNAMEEIDFIYMINLDERPEKLRQTTDQFALYGIHPYRFSAVNGWKLTTEAINQVGVKFIGEFPVQFLGSIYREFDGQEFLGNEILRPNGETFFSLGMSRGAIGIILSHLSILQDAYDSGYHTIWVLEDDVEAIKDPNILSGMIQKLDALIEDWDILFTDTDTKDRDGNHIPCRATAARPNVKIEPLSSFYERFYSIDADLSRIGMRYGAYSMVVRRSGMKKILDYYKFNGIFLPYDMDIWLNPDLKMYAVNSDIVSHRAHSPTDNSYPNYLKEKAL